MTPLETAMKLASASANCEKYKCPFASKCKGDYTTCGMKEVAMMLRAQNAEIESLKAMTRTFSDVIASMHNYIVDIEKINKRYHDIIVAFEHGYRPKNAKSKKRVPKPKKDPKEMDGDERYACVPERTREPEPPLVVI